VLISEVKKWTFRAEKVKFQAESERQ